MLLTRKMLRDCWNNSSPEEKAATIAELEQQRAEDMAFMEQWERDEQVRLNTPAPPGSPRKVALRAKLAARPLLPTLWYENEAGERWLTPVDDPTATPPEGYIYQWSRFPTVLRETALKIVQQSEVDVCPHTDVKPDLGIIDSMEGRECVRCHGYQSKNKGEPWPVKWEAMGSREYMSGDSSWPGDLVLAMVRPSPAEMYAALGRHGEEPRLLGLDDAIILAATSCERCLNGLLWRYGLDDGYPPYSPEWNKTNTKCGICETPGVWDWLMNEKNIAQRTRQSLKSGEHYTEICRECGTVMGQCRCSSPNKVMVYGLCDACAGEEAVPGTARYITVEELRELGNAKLASVDFSPEVLARLRTVLLTEDELAARIATRYLEALTPRQRGWEKRREKDDFTEQNIPPEHLLLWRKLKNQFKGTPDERATRFMEWLEEHPGESDVALQERANKDVSKLVREQDKERREQVKVEKECDKNQTKYENAWYTEQARVTREKNKLKQLKEQADAVCENCPTCHQYGPDEEREMLPFAASQHMASTGGSMDITERVAARYKSKKKVKTESGDTATIYEYSENQVARRNADKAKRLEGLRKNIGNLRAKVKRDLKSSDPEKALTALAVALIDHTYERVGNDTSAKERGHVGVTGWQKSHISFGRGKATIKYTGKSGVEQKKTVSDKAVLAALRNAYEACGDDEGCLFEHATGKVGADKINAYLEAFDVSAKDLRGFHANREMQERLSAIRGKGGKLSEDAKERKAKLKEEFKKALEETAEAVGHEPSTLKSQYLVPGLEESFMKDGTVMSKMKAASYEDEPYTYDRS